MTFLGALMLVVAALPMAIDGGLALAARFDRPLDATRPTPLPGQ